MHQNFQDVDGFPFLRQDQIDGTYIQRHYVDDAVYNDVFQTTQLGHAQLYAKINVDVNRCIPEAVQSVFAGAK